MKREKHKKRVAYLLSFLLLRFLILLPFPVFQGIIRCLAIFSVNASPGMKLRLLDVPRKNIRVVFPEWTTRSRERLLRNLVQETGRNFYYAVKMYRKRDLAGKVNVSGLDYLQRTFSEGRGVILLSAHMGSFPLLLARLNQLGYPVGYIGRDPSNRLLNRYFNRILQGCGITTISQNPARVSVRRSVTWLKQGKILAVLADQHSRNGVTVPFFGRPTGTPTGPAVFARRLNCPVVPAVIIGRNNRHLVKIEPPLKLYRGDNYQEDITANTTLFNQTIQRWVREHPDQWLSFFSRRFR